MSAVIVSSWWPSPSSPSPSPSPEGAVNTPVHHHHASSLPLCFCSPLESRVCLKIVHTLNGHDQSPLQNLASIVEDHKNLLKALPVASGDTEKETHAASVLLVVPSSVDRFD